MKTNKLSEFSTPYQIAYTYWNMLRSIGFNEDNIFMGYDRVIEADDPTNTADVLFIQLKLQGSSFTMTVGHIPGATEEEVKAEWVRLCNSVAAASSLELHEFMRKQSHLATVDEYRKLVVKLEDRCLGTGPRKKALESVLGTKERMATITNKALDSLTDKEREILEKRFSSFKKRHDKSN